MRAYGETHGIKPLVTTNWHAHEADGWEMTSIAAYLLDAKGAYRTPQDSGFTFMVLTNVQWAAWMVKHFQSSNRAFESGRAKERRAAQRERWSPTTKGAA